LLSKHRQHRGTAAAAYRKALFNIFGESELPFISSSDSNDVILAWKASQKTRRAYEVLFEPMPNSETTYIERVLEKTCDVNTPIHKKAFAIITCENLLNPKRYNIVSKETAVKPLLLVFEVSFIYNLYNKKSYLIKKNNAFRNFRNK
jgi:hypothetical protein